jgi:hypothetical protein
MYHSVMAIIKDLEKGGGEIRRILLSEVPYGGIFLLTESFTHRKELAWIKIKPEEIWMKPKVTDTTLLANNDVIFCIAIHSGDGDFIAKDLKVAYLPNATIINPT